jgi:hypothetical protein
MAFTTTFPLADSMKLAEGLRALATGGTSAHNNWELADAGHTFIGYVGGTLRATFGDRPQEVTLSVTEASAAADFIEAQCRAVQDKKQAAIDIPPWLLDLVWAAVRKWLTGG